LRIDLLSEEDVNLPIVLVKDHRDSHGDDHIDIFHVPKSSDKYVDDIDVGLQTNNRKRLRSGLDF